MNGKRIGTIGVMTSGGDAPGMNSCIRAVVRTAMANGVNVLGVEGGYDGLLAGRYTRLGLRDVGGILQRGGTILQTARSEELSSDETRTRVMREMNNAGMDALVVIGGKTSIASAAALAERGVTLIGIPASIENEVYGTDMCIGVDTALNTIVDAIDKIRDTASSHTQAFLVETMGRDSGYLALQAAIITGAEMALIPELETPVDEVVEMVESAYRRGKTHCIIVVADGSHPQANELAEKIDSMDTGFATRVSILGHIQRGGKPSAFDRLLSSRFGMWAVQYLLQGEHGVMVGLNGREIRCVPLADVVSKQRSLPMDYYEMAKVLAK
jgi:6-phosphofructokinase 1